MSPYEVGAGPSCTLVITAPLGTEVFIIDAKFCLIGRGRGDTRIQVMPGIYKVRFRRGDEIADILCVAEPGQPSVAVTAPRLQFRSPAPLAGTSTTSTGHQQIAATLSRQVHVTLGEGAQLFLFARDLEPTEAGTEGNSALLRGLSLLDTANRKLLDLGDIAMAGDSAEAACAGCTLAVAPGTYRLALDLENRGRYCMSLIASPDWQTQVFLPQTRYGGTKTKLRYADLVGACMLMARRGAGFDPDEQGLRLAELTRIGLLKQRQLLSPDELERLLSGKFENPMLGILGGYMLRLADHPDVPLIRRLADNLHRLLGSHADVDVLAASVDESLARTLRLETPPMLRTSWDALIDLSLSHPSAVPASSPNTDIARHLWGQGPWLI